MRSAVVAARWPNGFVCDRCQCTRFSPTHNGRRLWQCKDCGYQSSSIVGSVMEHTKLPLTTWFLAMHWMTQSKGGIGALPLMRYLGVSYPTAWLIRHKLMQVMFEREQATVLSGRIEIDDAFLGGEQPGRQGRGGNKVPFVAAVETDLKGRPQIVRFDRVDNHGIKSIQQWAAMAIAPLANGKALVGGFFGLIENTPRGMLVWLNSDGTVDASFATATNANSSAGAIAQLAADKPLVGGSFTQVGTPTPLVNHSRLVRLNADGTLDATFVGPTALNGSVSALRPLGDGRAYVSGTFASIKLTASSASNPAYRHVVRLDPTGALETAFSAGTAGASMLYATATPNSALPSSVVVMATFSNDASLFVAGNFHSFAGAPHGNFARLNAINIATPTAIVSHGSVVSEVGSSYTVTYAVSHAYAGSGAPSGSVTVSDGSNSCVGTLPALSCNLPSTAAATVSLPASYAGDSIYNASVLPSILHNIAPAGQVGSITVTVAGSGSGAVLTGDGRIACGATSSSLYANTTVVTLNAVPAVGQVFGGWLGACSGVDPCVVTVNGASAVSATFAPASPALNFDIDGNGSARALTDGLLVVRYLLSLSGSALTTSAIAAGIPAATRTLPADVLIRLNNLRPMLDIDGNGQVDAVTDGVLLLRYLINVRCNALTLNAVGTTPRRPAAAAMEDYIQAHLL